jgi:phosphonatase-like hydrolase
MQIHLAVFDIAGTTVVDENFVALAFKKAFSEFGFDIGEEDINPLMGYKKTYAIERMLKKLGAEYDAELVEDIHAAFTEEMIDFYEYDPQVKPLPSVEETLQLLKEKGIRIAFNTGFPRAIADVIMNRLQWKEKGLADDYIASDEVNEGRPQPYMIKELMQRAGIQNAEAVAKIGDTEVDIHEGKNAGCGLVIAVTTGAYRREELEQYGPDHIIDTLAELPRLIN